ncbi:MAG: extracellular solute-binding protein, partial [Chloroflexaceae bacterium]|nr:extracellular solute-binding protein [Chloroflexaceae bacterium]
MDTTFSFGYWLRRRRKALDLTQAELARRVGCAETTIRKIEADARRPSRQIAERMADVLALAADERTQFLKVARAELSTARLTVPAHPLNATRANSHPTGPATLPAQLTPLIGRDQETAAVGELLRRSSVRLVTLTGIGGVGKTRLAIDAATSLLDDFEGGVHFVALAPTSDPDRVLGAIAATLGVPETYVGALAGELKHTLHDKQLLLILDNFEQVITAAPLVTDLLSAAPQLKILVTSREVLRLSGEYEYPVPPLALPSLERLPPPESLVRYPAIELFVQRSQAVKPTFTLTRFNAAAVVEICRRLDGLPLAIELVAARSRLFLPDALLVRLRDRFALLTGGAQDLPARQQTLRNALDWSYDLLEVHEQAVFRRLGIFVGGCTLEAAEAVCGDDQMHYAVFDVIASLVNKSLVQHEPGTPGEPRFGMLETVREYALNWLEASGEREATQQRYKAFFFQQARNVELDGDQQEWWLDWLASERENLRAALRLGSDSDGSQRMPQGHREPAVTYCSHLHGLTRSVDQMLFTRFADATHIPVRHIEELNEIGTCQTNAFEWYLRLCEDVSNDIDVIMLDLVWTDALAPYLVDLQPALGTETKHYYARIIENNTIDGRLVAMPWIFDVGMLYYRLDLLQKYGFAAPPTTWDELEQQAQVIAAGERRSDPDFAGFIFEGLPSEGLTCTALEWLASNGAGHIIEDGQITLNNPQAVATLNRVRNWLGTIAPRRVIEYNEG